MVSHRLAGAPLDFAALRSELSVPGEFPSDAQRDAEAAAAAPPPRGLDRTDIPFVTVDPAGSRDLDQAVHIARTTDGGYLVSYAIADVAAFVRPGSALDAETHRRGETLYFPDLRVPLHPTVLSEGAASLLPGIDRPAVLWQITLDDCGDILTVDVRRALVRSRAQLDYDGLARALADGSAPDAVTSLPAVGERRLALARERHAIDLELPEQHVERDASGAWTLSLRRPTPVEAYNAQISLLTGMCAAQLMHAAGFGILRTVPPPDPRAVQKLRRVAPALDVAWPEGAWPGDVIATLDLANPKHAAFVEQAAALLRGSGYTAFDAAWPDQPDHAGVGAPYAHVTAPLRRLVDRYGAEICLSAKADVPVPDWVRATVPELPGRMQSADKTAHAADRAVVDTTEAWLLADRIGESFDAIVLDADDHHGTVTLDDPAVRASCVGHDLPIGEHIRVRLVAADVATRSVKFERT